MPGLRLFPPDVEPGFEFAGFIETADLHAALLRMHIAGSEKMRAAGATERSGHKVLRIRKCREFLWRAFRNPELSALHTNNVSWTTTGGVLTGSAMARKLVGQRIIEAKSDLAAGTTP